MRAINSKVCLSPIVRRVGALLGVRKVVQDLLIMEMWRASEEVTQVAWRLGNFTLPQEPTSIKPGPDINCYKSLSGAKC
ncbi:hypothetical protein RRG08_052090 [Elysia crispata]|uniref:Uncharacterized protein n=1 Tax=Elysia crispata TaxID=231223 RepID=A0AAE1A416_9GAST|nr:hypothetical protein RRG08_052090 [Elysia crispata]